MTNKPYVFAVRIYYNDYQLMADLVLSSYERITICWDKPAEREKYYFDGYTLYYDTRQKPQWDKWLNKI